MSFDEVSSSSVIRPPNLWVHQAEAGETGRKTARLLYVAPPTWPGPVALNVDKRPAKGRRFVHGQLAVFWASDKIASKDLMQ